MAVPDDHSTPQSPKEVPEHLRWDRSEFQPPSKAEREAAEAKKREEAKRVAATPVVGAEPGATDEANAVGEPSSLDAAASKIGNLRRSLMVQEGDSKLVGFGKIVAMGLIAILLVLIAPLVILGLFTGLAAAA